MVVQRLVECVELRAGLRPYRAGQAQIGAVFTGSGFQCSFVEIRSVSFNNRQYRLGEIWLCFPHNLDWEITRILNQAGLFCHGQ